MSDQKTYSPREAAQAVLAKAQEILVKSETLKKYATEMKAAPSKPKADSSKKWERDYNDYEVKSGTSKDSNGKRQEEQVSPSKNPKEAAEGNNQSDGMEPRYEFKDKVKGEIAKENKAHEMDKAESLAKKYEGFKAVEASAAKSGASDPAAVAAAAGMKKYGKKKFEESAHAGKKMGKAENPDKNADAKLGEKVEEDVEQHMEENKEAEKQEGHKMAKEKTDTAIIPRLIGSAKLSKFMEHMHSKRKAKMSSPAEEASHAAQGTSDEKAGEAHEASQAKAIEETSKK